MMGHRAVWNPTGNGEWQGRKIFIGSNKEVFDAELYAIWLRLAATGDHQDEWAALGPKAIAIFTDVQTAFKRIRNDDPGPGQWLAQRILRAERQLHRVGWITEFRWVPGHKGIEGNEAADRWAKEAAGASDAAQLPREEESITTLAHVARGVTERKWHEHLAWVKERCRGKRCYLFRERQRTDPNASRARKTLATRFYQLRMNKASPPPRVLSCGDWAGQGRQVLVVWQRRGTNPRAPLQILPPVERPISHHVGGTFARRWKGSGCGTPLTIAQLFGDERCTAAILEFLQTTEGQGIVDICHGRKAAECNMKKSKKSNHQNTPPKFGENACC
jgi:hypothetical protein